MYVTESKIKWINLNVGVLNKLALDILKIGDIIISDLSNNSQKQKQQEKIKHNMKTNATTAAVSTTPQVTLKEAVTNAVNELKVKGSFSAHDVTSAIRAAVNGGEIAIPGLEAQPNSAGISFWVKHEDVKAIVDEMLEDGTLANLGLTNVNFSGAFRVFEFATPAASTDTDADPASATNAPATNGTQTPLEQRIKAYLSKAGSATLKQIQSALKVNGVTCADLAPIVTGLGYTLTAGTTDCYSTYTAN